MDEGALDDEEYRAEAHQEESWERNGVGVARADCVDGLWHVAAHHADGSEISHDVCNVHSVVY